MTPRKDEEKRFATGDVVRHIVRQGKDFGLNPNGSSTKLH